MIITDLEIAKKRPNAKYVFKQILKYPSRYELIQHEGADVQNFPAVYTKDPKKGDNLKGKKYIGKRKYDSVEKYEYALELNGCRIFTGYNVNMAYPTKAYGDDKNPHGLNRNDAILIHLLDGENIEVYFFFDLRDIAKTLWQKWCENKLCMTVDTIPTVKEKPADGQNV